MTVMRSALVMDTVWLLHFSAIYTRSWVASPDTRISLASVRPRFGFARDVPAAGCNGGMGWTAPMPTPPSIEDDVVPVEPFGG